MGSRPSPARMPSKYKNPVSAGVPVPKPFAVRVPPRGTVSGPGPSAAGKCAKYKAPSGILSNCKFNAK